MKIEELLLENFRCYEKRRFLFNDSFTVLVGNNGSGKTAILDAVAILLGTYFQGWDVSTGSRTINRTSDPREVPVITGGQLNFEKPEPVTLQGTTFIAGQSMTWLRNKGDRGAKAKDFIKLGSDSREAVSQGKQVDLPLFIYYGAGRLWEINRDIKIEKPKSRLDAYRHCLQPTSDRKAFEAWFKQTTLAAHQKKKDLKEIVALTLVEKAVLTCLPEGFTKFGYDVEENQLLLYEGNKPTKFNQLSSGYQNMVAMVADIAYRAFYLNPHLSERAIIEAKGIVLIDEIELHLHPSWQRRVVDDLKEAFPNLQFIVTTHSPFIIQSLNQNEIIDLNQDAEHQPVLEPNSSIEDIVESIQGIELPQRSHRYQEMYQTAQKYYKLLEELKTAPSEELSRLEDQLNELTAPFSDNVAYHAFLEMERQSARSTRGDEV